MKGLRWRSVTVPVMHAQARRRRADRRLPAHAVHADRRRRLLRLGADVPRASTALRARAAALSARRSPALAEIVAQWADTTLFWTAVPYTMQPAGAAHIFAGAPPECAEGVRRRPRGDDAPACGARRSADGAAALASYLGWLESHARRRARLAARRTLARSPTSRSRSRSGSCAARRRSRRMLGAYPRLVAWFERVARVRPRRRRRRWRATRRSRSAAARRATRRRGRAQVAGFAAGAAVTVSADRLRARRGRRHARRPRRATRSSSRATTRAPAASTCISRASASRSRRPRRNIA